MSSKPATPAASRAGVPGAPRVLVYVADPRQLEPGAAAAPPAPPPPPAPAPLYHDNLHHISLPRNTLFRTQIEQTDQRAPSNTVFYKSLNHSDSKLSTCGVGDNALIQRTDFFSVAQQFPKESGLKLDDSKSIERQTSIAVRRDCSNSSINSEVCGVETYNARIPIETGEIATYQSRCPGPLGQESVQSLQPVVLPQGFNQFIESGTGQSLSGEGRNGGDRELVDKSYVNYQFSEQSVSHQSIVNQSISILNQQVGVSAGLPVEAEAPQLVRTPEGLVLAVLPPPADSSLNSRTVLSESIQTIVVPLGWRRIVSGTSVLYISPCGTALSTLPQLREYLQTAGTCKCGLPCPLRPETTFSFDTKVASKPYQAASGAELTKLCNHKRKLLATLQARAQSPSTPPPQHIEQKKGSGVELPVLKKKMKKRPGFPASMSASQLLVQRERPLTEFKPQDNELNRTLSPGTACGRGPAGASDDGKHEPLVHRGAHYLTVNSGWITQQESMDAGQKQSATNAGPGLHNALNVGMPVLGTNGQIIGVNTGYNKHGNYTNKNAMGMMQQNIAEQEQKEEKKDAPQQNMQPTKTAVKDESQIFCGLNQPLTPEVMQKINEQQQLFIQQNQKQIEMAMKGYRTQLVENAQNKAQSQNQYVPQGQLVIQNGAVVKTNPAKTPPWQVKRTDSTPHPMMSPSPKPKLDIDYDDTNLNISEDTSTVKNSFVNNDHSINQAMCSRVPPLPQHYNMMGQQWPAADVNKKKVKNNNKGSKKKNNAIENKMIPFNNGMRLVQDAKAKVCDDISSNNVPSFMDDPNGYLAQQTVLLNNTISRQVGINSSFDGNQYDNMNNCYGGNNQPDKSCKPSSKSCDGTNVYRSNTVPNLSPSPNTAPDSSVLSDRGQDGAQCCKGCNVSYKGNNSDFPENQTRLKYMKQNLYKMEADGSPGRDDPVTSSTARARSPGRAGPVQAGAVSTSRASPARSPPAPASAPTAPQLLHFISNHNVNRSLMDVDNIAMLGVRPGLRLPLPRDLLRAEPRRRPEHAMPGYCPPPHLGGGPPHSLAQAGYLQTFVTTMASGFSVTRDTVTSVLAGRANTATTSINASRVNFVRPPPPPSVNMATTYAIPNNQPDPFINSVNLPTSYPLHIAGTTAQNMISKSPLEMVQNVIGNVPTKPETSNALTSIMPQMSRRPCPPTTPGQILISSTGQIIVSSNQMLPPPPKTTTAASPPQGAGSGGGGAGVVVGALPAPFVLQPSVVAVDGQLVPPGAVLPQLVPPHALGDSPRQLDDKNGQHFMQGVAMLSPESLKKRNKKKKPSNTNMTNVLQITTPQQNSNNIMVHHSSPQHSSNSQYSPRGFQLSPNNNISPGPMLQALTIVPGKSGTPAHIVMNGQNNSNNFTSQQIIANTSPSQQINLLQPVNLINNASGVMPNFPAFQQFIVPNLGGMVMTADGTAIIQDNASGMPVQLQLQTVNGQNVLTPLQSPGVFAAGAVLRPGGKLLPAPPSPGAQFLSPGAPLVVNSPGFGGQLSPLLASLSPTNVAFSTSPHPVRSGNVQAQEFIQTNQMGQTLMVPLSPKQVSIASTNRANSTFVQQNTTIVQQQTTLVSASHNTHSSLAANLQGGNSRLSIDPNVLLAHKQIQKRNFIDMPPDQGEKDDKFDQHDDEVKADTPESYAKLMGDFSPMGSFNHVRHSVSTQTLLNQQRGKSPGGGGAGGCSAPDTTTLSPLGAEPAASPRARRAASPEPADASSSAMVQCVSSSEQDMAEAHEMSWRAPRTDFSSETDAQSVMSNLPLTRQNRNHNPVESTDMHYMQNLPPPPPGPLPVGANYYERTQAYKRKNDFGDGSTYRMDKMIRNTYGMVHGLPKEDYDNLVISSAEKSQTRHYSQSGTSSDASNIQKAFDRHGLGAGNDNKNSEGSDKEAPERAAREFQAGDVVWGPVKGHASWPGKLRRRAADGRWLVRWFGARPPSALPRERLLSLSDGLEAHHAARTRHRKSRKLNTLLENAIQEAMAELDKKSEASESVGDEESSPPEASPPAAAPRRARRPPRPPRPAARLRSSR